MAYPPCAIVSTMLKRLILPLIVLCFAAGCQSAPPTASIPTELPFPTMTPGQVIRAALPPPNLFSIEGSSPATAIALSSQPTATPNLASCPPPNSDYPLPLPVPVTGRSMETVIGGFLSVGGTAVTLDRGLRETWGVIGDSGQVRGDIDLSGEGTPEIIASFVTPDEGGAVMIFACVDGRYAAVYFGVLGGDAPDFVRVEDMNADGRTDIMYATSDCSSGECRYRTQLVGWSRERGRVVNLLDRVIESAQPPRVEDLDQDRVNEIIEQMNDSGNAETGPLRTGFNVYDWNGATYTRSITQLNPPRFRIQIIHQADEAFSSGSYPEAISLYTLALTDPNLEAWRSDELQTLQAYTLYRMLLAYTFTGDTRSLDAFTALQTQFPDPVNAPVYSQMGQTFWNAFQITNNLNSACLEVQSIISTRPEALGLINRYGSRSPTYSAQDLCPF